MLNGMHLACRTLLHMRTVSSDINLFLDKIASLFFVILLSVDFFGILHFPFWYKGQNKNTSKILEDENTKAVFKNKFQAYVIKNSTQQEYDEA